MALVAALVVNAGLARADDTFSLLNEIKPNQNSCSGTNSLLGHFDISWFDSLLGIYLLADRTNKTLDVFDANFDTCITTIPGSPNPFSGQQTSNAVSGPDGVLTVNGRYVFVGNGDNTVRVIDLFQQAEIFSISIPIPQEVVAVTAGNRADEMAYDPRDHILAVANDSPSPSTASPYLTFISTTPTNPAVFGILGQVVIADATSANGLEQTAYSSKTGLFYTSVPVVNGTKAPGTGEIAVINPRTRRIVGNIPVSCQPAGLAIGPNLEAMVGCSDGPVQIVSLKTGASLATFKTLGFADQVWFNKGSGQYFVAQTGATKTKGTKVTITEPAQLGVVNADTHQLDQLIPTTIGDHSVAADAELNHIFLPDTSTPAAGKAGCGCIKVFNVTGEDVAAK
jgi:WD40 repeat protein